MNIAVVTGASSGLGRQLVMQLDKNESLDEIWIIARREERLLALQSDVKVTLRPLAYDLLDKSSIESLSMLLKEKQPRVIYLINAAGFGKIGGYDVISIENNENMIDLNCRAAVAMTQAVIPFMPEGSHIMEVCSTAAFQPFQFLSVYSASKAFLYRYSRALRVELFPKKISVTAVCPYWIKDTEFIETATGKTGKKYIKGYPFASSEKNVAKWAYQDTKAKMAVSAPGPMAVVHRIFAKFIPGEIMMGIWALFRRL